MGLYLLLVLLQWGCCLNYTWFTYYSKAYSSGCINHRIMTQNHKISLVWQPYADLNLYHGAMYISVSLVDFMGKVIGLTLWGWVMHMCISKAITGSENGLSPFPRQAITWTSADLLSIKPLRTNSSEIFNWNSNIFIEENAFESVICPKSSILSQASMC